MRKKNSDLAFNLSKIKARWYSVNIYYPYFANEKLTNKIEVSESENEMDTNLVFYTTIIL